MPHAYATVNAAAGLAAAAFTWSTGATADRANLVDGAMDKLCSSGSAATPIDLTIDFGSATAVQSLALLNHNLATGWSSPTVTVDAADDAAMTTNHVTPLAATAINVTAPNHKDCFLSFTGTAATKRYWRLRFSDGGATRTVTLGEVWMVGTLTSLTRKQAYGHGENEEYLNNVVEMANGEKRTSFRAGPLRTKLIPFVTLNASDKAEVMAMWRATKGGSVKLLWAEYLNAGQTPATADQECLYGRLQPRMGWTEPDFLNFDLQGLELVSLAREVGA